MRYFFVLILISQFTFSQIRGVVKDSLTGNPIPYVNIWVENENIGTTSEEKIVAGYISDIEQKVKEAKAEAPAIIIVGEVVKESVKLAEVYREVVAINRQSQ